jgi:putative SOS response-associated peptidase YedK
MCGRFTITVPAAEIAELMGLPELPAFAPRYNVKPTTPILVVRELDGRRVAETPVWGFAPAWSTTLPVINATVEKVRAKSPYWRAATKNGRCLVPMSAGYEWKDAGTKKSVAHAFGVLPKHSLFAVAGLIDNGTAALITCPPNPFMAKLHDRMPAILAPAEYDAWLREGDLDLLRPFDGAMYAYPVDKMLLKDRDVPESLVEVLVTGFG